MLIGSCARLAICWGAGLGGGGSADPFGDEWDMNMSMNMSDMSGNSNSPDWTATMDINPGAFQRGQVDNSELAELATTNL